MFSLIEKKNYMLAFLELTHRFKKLKRRASLECCVHLEYESNRNRLFYKTVSGNFEILHRFKAFFASLFGLSLAEISKIEITF